MLQNLENWEYVDSFEVTVESDDVSEFVHDGVIQLAGCSLQVDCDTSGHRLMLSRASEDEQAGEAERKSAAHAAGSGQ